MAINTYHESRTRAPQPMDVDPAVRQVAVGDYAATAPANQEKDKSRMRKLAAAGLGFLAVGGVTAGIALGGNDEVQQRFAIGQERAEGRGTTMYEVAQNMIDNAEKQGMPVAVNAMELLPYMQEHGVQDNILQPDEIVTAKIPLDNDANIIMPPK